MQQGQQVLWNVLEVRLSGFVDGCMEVFNHTLHSCYGGDAMIVACTLPGGTSCLYLITADHHSK